MLCACHVMSGSSIFTGLWQQHALHSGPGHNDTGLEPQ
jgi:hypothetical protein